MFICAVMGNILFTSVSFLLLLWWNCLFMQFMIVHLFEINQSKLFNYESIMGGGQSWYTCVWFYCK
jgi:hypothetical protein